MVKVFRNQELLKMNINFRSQPRSYHKVINSNRNNICQIHNHRHKIHHINDNQSD